MVSTATGQALPVRSAFGGHRPRTRAALLIRGELESASGVINVVADKLIPLKISTRPLWTTRTPNLISLTSDRGVQDSKFQNGC